MDPRELVRSAANRLGLEVRRFPKWDPRWRTVKLLESHDVATVLDVGANLGQYASGLRTFGYEGTILSFEPVSDVFARLASVAADDDTWAVHNVALGADERVVDINVAANEGASSSILSMLDRHRDAAPGANFVRSETVAQSTVDHQLQDRPPGERHFLKVDAQGYEGEVLAGATRSIASGAIVGVQLEVSFVPLYESAPTWLDMLSAVSDLGMVPVAVDPGFMDPRTGELLQADFLFFSDHPTSASR
jgi:FkbM family methyltransferase